MYDTKNTGLNLHIQSRFANVSEDSCEVNAHHGDQNAQDTIDPEDVDEYGQQDTTAKTGCHTADRAGRETMFAQWSSPPSSLLYAGPLPVCYRRALSLAVSIAANR